MPKTQPDPQVIEALTKAIEQVFGKNTDAGRFVDVSRIPLICKSIININERLKEMTAYIKNDNNWKSDFDIWKTKVIEPLVQKEAQEKTIRDWQLKELKMVGTLAGVAISIWLALHYWGFLIGIHI